MKKLLPNYSEVTYPRGFQKRLVGNSNWDTFRYSLLASFLFALASFTCTAQDLETPEERKSNKIALGFTHTLVPTAINNEGDRYLLALPSWGLDYDRFLNPSWGIGLHADVVIQNFEYEDGKGLVKERNKPVAIAGVVTRKVGKGLTLLAGGGVELSPNEETLGLIRLGVDYGWELPKDLEVAINLMTDIKINAYNAAVFGFSIGKKF